MNAGEIIKTLLTLGTVIHDALAKSQGGGGAVDWTKFLDSGEFKAAEGAIKELAGSLKAADVGPAIKEIDQKQTSLLNGRNLSDLSTEELGDYSALSRARLMLATSNLQTALQPAFWQWVTDQVLPALVNIAPTVLALLL